MDQADAQQTYASQTDYEMKRDRKEVGFDALGGDRPKKRYKGVDPNKTKVQNSLLSKQLVERLTTFCESAKTLLSEPGHGIPTVTEIRTLGRRVQDKANLKAQMAAEKNSVAKLRREKMTFDTIKLKAKVTDLSNDRIMRLREERL